MSCRQLLETLAVALLAESLVSPSKEKKVVATQKKPEKCSARV